MRKLILLLLFPFIVATTCDDDFDSSGYETSYLLQNNSSSDLFLLSETNLFKELLSQTTISIGSQLNNTANYIPPSESYNLNSIKLYKKVNNDYILVYLQFPIDDSLWKVSETRTNKIEATFTIIDEIVN